MTCRAVRAGRGAVDGGRPGGVRRPGGRATRCCSRRGARLGGVRAGPWSCGFRDRAVLGHAPPRPRVPLGHAPSATARAPSATRLRLLVRAGVRAPRRPGSPAEARTAGARGAARSVRVCREARSPHAARCLVGGWRGIRGVTSGRTPGAVAWRAGDGVRPVPGEWTRGRWRRVSRMRPGAPDAAGAPGAAGAPSPGRATRELLDRARRLHDAARALLDDHSRACRAVRETHAALLAELVDLELGNIPVHRLEDATEGRVKVAHLERAGLASVRDVHRAAGHELERIPGVSRQTARQAAAAAQHVAGAVRDHVAVRLDPTTRGPAARPSPSPSTSWCRRAPKPAGRWRPRDVRTGRGRGAAARRARRRPPAHGLRRARSGAAGSGRPPPGCGTSSRTPSGVPCRCCSGRSTWTCCVPRPTMSRPGSTSNRDPPSTTAPSRRSPTPRRVTVPAAGLPDPAAAEGFLPARIAEHVRAQPLDDTPCNVSCAWLPVLRRPLRPRTAKGRPRRRDGARQDHPGHRRACPPRRAGRAPLPRRLPGQRADQLEPGDPGPQQPAARADVRGPPPHGVRRVVRAAAVSP